MRADTGPGSQNHGMGQGRRDVVNHMEPRRDTGHLPGWL